ncbi:MAG: sulfotransferase [Proteobacteria bacterium]|nr:sulfotransferase [Pseudomonadota bacterium]
MLAREFDTAMKAQDIPRAVGWAKRAMEEGFAHPMFFNIVAYLDIREGRVKEAIALLNNGLTMAPEEPNLLNQLGVAYNHLGQYDDAIAAFGRAVAAAPKFGPPHYNRGVAYEGKGDVDRARKDYVRAVELQPDYPDALSRLAYTDAMRGRYAAALDYAHRTLKLNPRNQLGTIAAATGEVALGKFDEAIARITTFLGDPLLGPVNNAILLGLLGDAFDGAGKPAPAFDAYTESNALLRKLYAPNFGMGAVTGAEMLRDYFAAAPAEAWAADTKAPADGHVRAHVFLVGFPRSGTTLLEQTLAGHTDVVTSEERGLLGDAVESFAADRAALDTLAAFGTGDLQKYRDAYWARAAGLDPKGKVFVDKLPLNVLLLPLVAKLFPHAKILFALRDPRDVVFSCFRRRFQMSNQMYELLTLTGAARYYDAVMGAAAVYRDKLDLDWRDVRHEDFVADYENQAKAVVEHLGLAWQPGIVDVAKRLQDRAVDTPSSAQITQGVRDEGVGAWRAYEPKLASVLPVLAPWVARFGYPA